MQDARIEAADFTGVVVDLRDAELARLELLNDALEPVFSELSTDYDMFDRALSHGATPRLWIDMVAHVVMGRDKRTYRFVQDTRHGRIVIAESQEIRVIVDAVTRYIARRLLERERAFAPVATTEPEPVQAPKPVVAVKRQRRWPSFLFGMLLGMVLLFGLFVFAALYGV